MLCLCVASFIAVTYERKRILHVDIFADFSQLQTLAAQGYSHFEVHAELRTAYVGRVPKMTKIKIGENFKKDLPAGNFTYHTNEYCAIVVTVRDNKKRNRIVYKYEPTDDNFLQARKLAALLKNNP
ncbi:hypothetical protein H0R92_02170 [Treponema sp. OMZ 840]|uniref:hypothetical protein n=1 Tax=Treponema sp. OMZ 840 TaxID=244313 RepID=UPI003D92D494